MPETRSRLRFSRFVEIRRDEQGRRLCRYCAKPVPPERRSYCSLECRHQFLIRASREYARKAYVAQFGRRCQRCGLDEGDVAIAWAQAFLLLEECGYDNLLKTFPGFQMDHARPVADGGGECGLDNYRLLCHSCHAEVTKRFVREWRQRGRGSGPHGAVARDRAGYRVSL